MSKPDAAGALLDADAAVVRAAQPFKDHRLLETLADLGDQPQLRILCGAIVALGLARGDRRLAATGLKMLAAHSVATWTKDFVKHRVDRTRPRSLDDPQSPGGDHQPEAGRSEAKEDSSFPSGHAAGAAAVARALARNQPGLAPAAYLGGAVLASAQIPRCAHYPTDVGAGVLIGLAAEAAVDRAWALAERLLGPAPLPADHQPI